MNTMIKKFKKDPFRRLSIKALSVNNRQCANGFGIGNCTNTYFIGSTSMDT